jgi:hypothetical protein
MIIIAIIVAVVGLIMYVLATNPKITEVGRIMFWTGLLSFLLGGGPTAAAGLFHH